MPARIASATRGPTPCTLISVWKSPRSPTLGEAVQTERLVLDEVRVDLELGVGATRPPAKRPRVDALTMT